MIIALLIAVYAQADSPFPNHYQEPYANSHDIRQEQYTQLSQYIDHLVEQSPDRRAKFFDPDYTSEESYVKSVEPYRDALKVRLGYPPPGDIAKAEPRLEPVGSDDYADIFRVWTPVLHGVEAYGLLFIPRGLQGKAPLLICQHGGGGSPEVVSAFEGPGNYGWMVQRGLQAGFICYAPALIFPLGGKEAIEGPDRKEIDQRLRYVGTSLLAVETFKISRAIDTLVKRDDVDSGRIGMVGLSYGGCYTLYAAALDTRIKAAVSSCYFNDRTKYAWPDWSYVNMLNEFTDPELVGLICPRALMIEVGINDELFGIDGAREIAPAAQAHYDRLGIGDRFQFVPFEGAHEFHGDTAYDFLKQHIAGPCSYCPPHPEHYQAEVKHHDDQYSAVPLSRELIERAQPQIRMGGRSNLQLVTIAPRGEALPPCNEAAAIVVPGETYLVTPFPGNYFINFWLDACIAGERNMAIGAWVCGDSPGALEVFVSNDRGMTWRHTSTLTLPTHEGNYAFMHMDPEGKGVIAVEIRGLLPEFEDGFFLYDTDDGGYTWRGPRFQRDILEREYERLGFLDEEQRAQWRHDMLKKIGPN